MKLQRMVQSSVTKSWGDKFWQGWVPRLDMSSSRPMTRPVTRQKKSDTYLHFATIESLVDFWEVRG